MEIENDLSRSRSICEGCLSVDRKITPLKDEECRKFFMETLSVEYREMLPINLCWECTALTRKAVKFKNQIRIAHRSIMDCLTYFNGQSLSCLDMKVQSKPMELNHDESLTGDVLTKTEINTDYYCNVYERGFQDEDIVKTDFQYEIVLEKEEESNEAVTHLDFSDSDDEPLTLKKEKRQEKEKKIKLKKEERESTRKRKRREKPAGVVDNQRVKKVLQELNVASGQLEMVVLTWDQVAAERDRALTSEVFTRHDYRCYDCVLGFNHKFKLENHMKKHDPSSGTSVCEVCKVRFRDSHALCAHNRRHRVRWRCVACGSLWSRAAVGADHVARAHQAPPPTHTCAACGHTETSLGRLRNHIKSHGERQKCEICGKTFKDRNSLRTHLFIHRGVKEYSCPQCDKRFLFKKSMEVHLVTHDAPAHLYCVQCDMNFKNQMSYYQHMKYNLKHIDPSKLKYACELCDKKFVKSSRLQEHHLAVHLKVTPVQCPEEGCHFSCSSRTVLRSHTRAVHRGKKAARNHVCHTCGKTYTSKKSLEGHLRSHTGERPFHCTLCPVSFGYEAALYNHNKLVHLKIKRGQERPQATAPTVTSTWEMAVNIPPDTQASGS